MVLNLSKGQGISLEKTAPGLIEIFVGLGWDTNISDAAVDFDIDASVFLLDSNEKLISDNHFIFYNNLISPDANKSVEHLGDNRTGEGEGDDEVIKVNLKQLSVEISKIVISATIHEAEARQQNFGQVQNAFIRIVDRKTEKEVIRFDLTEDFSVETALVMAEIHRQHGEWQLNAVGSGYQGGLSNLLKIYQ